MSAKFADVIVWLVLSPHNSPPALVHLHCPVAPTTLSFNPNDVAELYCPFCHTFLGDSLGFSFEETGMPIITSEQTGDNEPLIGGIRSREELLAWAKKRAMQYLDRGQYDQAFQSFAADLAKDGLDRGPDRDKLLEGLGLLIETNRLSVLSTMRRWIEEFE